MKKTLKDLPNMKFVKREIHFEEGVMQSSIKYIDDYFFHESLNREFIRRTWQRLSSKAVYHRNNGIGWLPVNPNPKWLYIFGGSFRAALRLCEN